MKLLDRILHREDLAPGPDGPYMRRWTLFRLFDYRLYLQRFLRSDTVHHMHDHPCDVWSLMLWGRYIETTPATEKERLKRSSTDRGRSFPKHTTMKVYRAPCLRRFSAEHIHRIDLLSENMGKTWTLCLFFPKRREWGFYLDDGTWIKSDYYWTPPTREERQAHEAARKKDNGTS